MEDQATLTFTPSLEQWRDLPSYIGHIERTGGAAAGIVKIKAPEGWRPSARDPQDLYNPSNMSFKISLPLQQHIKPTATRGAFQSTSQALPELSVEHFVRLATSQRYVTPGHQSYEELEKLYWGYDSIDRADDPIYGADVQHTLIDEDRRIWNVAEGEEGQLFNDLGRRLTRVDAGSYLYFGMWKTTFSWHIEDMDLYGINYLHYGAPKHWYCVPPAQAYRLERAAEKLFPQWAVACKNFLRHKVCMMSPELLQSMGVTVNTVVQEERDLIVVFPHAYHSGFNHGFNIAEASNFGTGSWVEHGKRHRFCTCVDNEKAIRLDMEPYVARYQPERLEAWRRGEDKALHPDDPPELWRVFSACRQVAGCRDLDGLPDGLLERLEGEGEELSERLAKLRLQCRKQLDHFTKFREVLPAIGHLLDFHEIKDGSEEWREASKVDAENVPEEPSNDYCHDLDIVKQSVRNAKRSKVKVKKKNLQQYLEKLPQKAVEKKLVKMSSKQQNVVKKTGFADVSQEELEAKKMMKKCYYKHKFWPCRKCSGCLHADCGQCWACQDKPKFGGLGVQKQKCQERKCSNPVVRGCDHCTWNLDFLSQTV